MSNKTPTNPKGSGRKLSGKTLLRFWTFPENKEKINELIKKLEDETKCVNCKEQLATHGIGDTKVVCSKCWDMVVDSLNKKASEKEYADEAYENDGFEKDIKTYKLNKI